MIDPNDYICKYCIGRSYSPGQGILLDRTDRLICPNCNREMVLKVIKDKPPLGLRSKIIHDQPRAVEILEAMLRYVKADIAVPQTWLDELKLLSMWREKDN